MGSKSAVMAATKPPAPMTNGLAKKSSASSSPALINLFPPSRQNSLRSNSISPSTRSSIGEEISLGEIFRLIAQMRVCIVRRAGSDVDGQISSLIEAATARSISPRGSEEAEYNSPVPHFLSVGQQSAGQMLDWVQRKGLPLIFLNGDCVGGFSDLKALDKCGFLAECLCPHLFDLVVIGRGEVAETAVQEAVQLGKRVALVELVQSGSNNGDQRKFGDSGQLAKQAVNQAALMRTAIEEARTSGWTVEGEQGQQVSFWLNWQSVRAVAQAQAQAQRQSLEAIFQQGKAQRFAALACQFTSFHELTICPGAESAERFQQEGLLKLTAARFLLTAKAETKALENVPGAKQHCISNSELFSLPHNPGKTLFCCEHDSEPAVLESAAILRALGNDVTIMSYVYGTALKSGERSAIKAPSILNPYDPEMVEYAKQRMAEKGVRFLRCVPTKFELMRESTPDQAPILRVFAMSMGKEGPMTTADKKAGITEEWSPFLEEFNTVILSIGKRAEPFPALGLEKIGVQLDGDSGRIVGRSQQPQSNSMPNIYAIGDALEGAIDGGTGWWNCFAARQLLRRMFQGAMAEIDQWDLCRTLLLLSPLEYAGCGLSQPEAERRHGKSSLNIFRDAEVPMLGVEKAKMICLRQEQNRVIGLHIMGPQAGQQLEGYALAMQLGLTKARMEAMGRQ